MTEITQQIVLNAIELDLGSSTFTPRGGEASASTGIAYDEEAETATISFGEALPVGAGTLEIPFTGILNDQLHGFYLSTFRDKDGVERRMAATQFEASDARRCFPCWDEPAVKSTSRSLDHPRAFCDLQHRNSPEPETGRQRSASRHASVHLSPGVHRG